MGNSLIGVKTRLVAEDLTLFVRIVEQAVNCRTRCFYDARIARKTGKSTGTGTWWRARRVSGGHVVQRQVLYLGEINDPSVKPGARRSRYSRWGRQRPGRWRCFRDRTVEVDDEQVVRIRLKDVEDASAPAMGRMLVGVSVVRGVGLDDFWAEKLEPSRKRDRWD